MNIENVKALADVLNTKGLSAIEIGEGENRIRIERDLPAQSILTQPMTVVQSTTPMTSASQASTSAGISENENPAGINNLTGFNTESSKSGTIEVKSPLVGVYYAAPSPDAETFVSIGSKVKKGDVLCIIETMKLMNEVTAEHDGEIIDICIKNGDIAEYGQILFKMV